jgi:hypothetical protein
MTTWNRTADFYVDVDAGGNPPLLDGKTSTKLNLAPCFIQADKFPLRLFFRKKAATTGGASAAVQHDPSDNIVFACKKTADLTGTVLLFSVTGFTLEGEEDDICYQAVLDLDTPAMRTAMASQTTPLAVRIDIEVQNADNTERATFQFDATIRKQVYNGEAVPSPSAPLYPAPNQLMLKHADGASIIFSEGKHAYLYCAETGLFHPLTAKLVDGHVVLATDDTGVLNP